MTKTIYYTYLGTNGTLTSPIHLEGIYSVKKYHLVADEGKILTNGSKQAYNITISEFELKDWYEIEIGQI